jgi:NAD(P)-dependent dehydrogenase (short-subunit alcohol dehydrogenase family)
MGKTAVVTGAGQGIGKSIAITLADAGYNLILVDINAISLDELKVFLNSRNVEINTCVCDLRQQESVENLFLLACDLFENIDVLVNNAGNHYQGSIFDVNENTWDSIFNLNLKSMFFLIQKIGKKMCEAGSGSIINISSISARSGRKDQAPYAAAKAGVISITQSAANEFGQYGVRVNSICPGVVNTDLTKKIHVKRASDAEIPYSKSIESITNIIPLRRISETEEIASVALFLCSESASYITGQAINVCGGLEMY